MSVSSFLSPMFWDEIGNSNYVRIELYSMNWTLLDVDLTALIGVGASYSGPVALRLDTNKLVKSSLATKWKDITIFSASGNLLAKVEKPNKLLKMGWSLEEDLVCVSEDGQVNLFDIDGRPKLSSSNKILSFGSDVRDIAIIDAVIYNDTKKLNTGVAILTTQYTFYVMPSIEQENYIRYPDLPGLNMPPSCWCVYFPPIPDEKRESQNRSRASILLAKDKFMHTLSPDGSVTDTLIQTRNPVDTFVACAVSSDGNYLALLGNTGVVWIGKVDLRTKFAEYDTKLTSYVPKEFAWCGTSAVVMYENKTKNLSLIDISGQCLRYDVSNDVFLISEMDGLRIFSETSHEMIQQIPQSVVSIANMASTTAGANLFAAAKLFAEKSAKSYDYLEEYKSDMEVAVDQCILAALECYFPDDQEELLRAAAFGKCFTVDPSGAEKFASACRTLRVLNQVRDPMIGLPLTHQQYKSLGVDVIIDRMILRNLWPLAVSMCDHLQIPESEGASRVKKHWACWKITQDSCSSRKMPDEELAKVIRDKLDKSTGISYADIAKRAIDCNREELAIKLLNYETRSSQQIHLLIKLNRHGVALDKAIQSGDPFSIYDVIINLQTSMGSLEFQRLMTSNPRALSYYLNYLKSFKRDQLLMMHGQSDDFLSQGLCKLDESYFEINNDNKISVLKDAKSDFASAKAEIVTQLTDDQIRLYKSQQAMDDTSRTKEFFGLSLHEYLLKLIQKGKYKEAENVKKDFKMSDKKYWWIKIEALASREDFLELDKFSKSKKSPIGYAPFVEVCLKYNRKQEAEKYLQRIPTEDRVMSYIRMGDLEKASEQAFVNKSIEELNKVAERCSVTLSSAGGVTATNLRHLMTRIQVNVEKLNS